MLCEIEVFAPGSIQKVRGALRSPVVSGNLSGYLAGEIETRNFSALLHGGYQFRREVETLRIADTMLEPSKPARAQSIADDSLGISVVVERGSPYQLNEKSNVTLCAFADVGFVQLGKSRDNESRAYENGSNVARYPVIG